MLFIMLSWKRGSKDRPPMLATGNYFMEIQIKRYKTPNLTVNSSPLSPKIHHNPDLMFKPSSKHPTQTLNIPPTKCNQSTRNRGKAIVTSSAPTYDPEPATVTEDEEKGNGD
ncbi:hypothetical protein Tco_0901016 [Tanacetum coccineum]